MTGTRHLGRPLEAEDAGYDPQHAKEGVEMDREAEGRPLFSHRKGQSEYQDRKKNMGIRKLCLW